MNEQTIQQTDFAEQLITKQAAIDCCRNEWEEEVAERIEALPSAQPETHEKRTETHARDCIERQAAISVIAKWMLEYGGEGEERERNALKQAAEEIKDLPSAQPTQNNTSNALKSLDCIDRQAAIDALMDDLSYYGARNEAPYGMSRAIGIIKKLSSAQPKRIKGIWLKKENVGRWDDTLWECSECGCLHSDNVFCISGNFNFCPNCGADMRGEQDG